MRWKHFMLNESMPIEGERVMVSDGTTQTIAYYILSDKNLNWFYDNPSMKDIEVQWFHELEDLPPIIQKISIDKNVE